MSVFDSKSPFNLKNLPPKGIDFDSPKITKALIKARAELAELKGYSEGFPNPLLLLSPAVIKDALASSEIENIVTTMLDVLQNQVLEESEQRKPDKEVLRYREAILHGFDLLKTVPISTRLIQSIQKKLLPEYSAGNYRSTQNVLHNPYTKEIIFTPPSANNIPHLIANLETFINNTELDIDPLIKTAIAHYQFEVIHPFGDGNGRTGRILMVLSLIQADILQYPILFISGYLNKNKPEYYKKLLAVSTENDWESFLLFILDAFYMQAKETKEMLLEIKKSFFEFKQKLKKQLPKVYTTEFVEKLFAYPVITPIKLGKEIGVHYTTASRYLKALKKEGFLKDLVVGKYHMYINEDLMDILYQNIRKK